VVLVFILVAVLAVVAGGTAMAKSRRRMRDYDDGEYVDDGQDP
jgi:hypothetical protein